MKWLFFLWSFSVFGAYIGNLGDPSIMNTGFFSSSYRMFKFTSGYIYDYTDNKRYVSAEDGAIKKFGLHSQMASASFILVERLQIYGTAGGSKENIQERPIYETVLDFHTNYHFSWSTGMKVILLQWGQTFLGCDFTYFSVPSSHKSFFTYLNRLNLPMETEKIKFSIDEWQLSAGLASRIFFITPYAGATYLKSKLHAQINYHNDVSWGYFYGLTLSLSGRLHVNFERRMRDEFAYTLSTIAVF